MTHIRVRELNIVGLDNGLSSGRRQAIIWTNAGILLSGPLATNFSEILIAIYIFSLKKIYMEMSSGNWWPFRLGLNVLINHMNEATVEDMNDIYQCKLHFVAKYDQFAHIHTLHAYRKIAKLVLNIRSIRVLLSTTYQFPNFNGSSLDMDKSFHSKSYNGYNYLSWLKLIHASKWGSSKLFI